MIGECHPVCAIVGPTASGKSELSQLVAERLDGEVVSADSMQIYRGMNIGTAKVLPVEQRVPHHLIDIIEPGEAYSASLFQRDARRVFSEIEARGKTPILCGGTGFYVQAALEAMEFPAGEQLENPVRERWQSFADEHGAQTLWDELNAVDPRSAAAIHPNNVRRVIRAFEMREEGVSYADQVARIKQLPEVVRSVRFGLQVDPEALRQRIELRVDRMFEQGLVEEVKGLLAQGFTEALTAPQAIGYKEVVAYLDGRCSLEQAREDIIIATRRYAKRQRSWFKRDSKIVWLEATEYEPTKLADTICQTYHSAQRDNQA